MTAQLSRERLEKIASWHEKFGSGHNVMLPAEEAEAMARMLLAVMDSEPVAVPDDFIIPELATLTNINKLCPLDVNLSQTDFATGWNDCRKYALSNGELPPIIKGVHAGAQGWNACRAAMLKAGPVTGWIKCSEQMPPLNNGQMWIYSPTRGVQFMFALAASGEYYDTCDSEKDITDATHWMPISTPASPDQEV